MLALAYRPVSILGPLGAGARSLRRVLLVGGVIGGHGLLVGSAISRKGIVSEGLSVGAIGVLPGALFAIPLVAGKFDDVIGVVLLAVSSLPSAGSVGAVGMLAELSPTFFL